MSEIYIPSATVVVSNPRGKGGLVNVVQHFCTSTEFRWHNLIGWCGNYLTCTRLLYYFTHHAFTDLLSTPPTCWSPANNFKGLATAWCEALLYSPDPPFLLEEGLGTRVADGTYYTVWFKLPLQFGKLHSYILKTTFSAMVTIEAQSTSYSTAN